MTTHPPPPRPPAKSLWLALTTDGVVDMRRAPLAKTAARGQATASSVVIMGAPVDQGRRISDHRFANGLAPRVPHDHLVSFLCEAPGIRQIIDPKTLSGRT